MQSGPGPEGSEQEGGDNQPESPSEAQAESVDRELKTRGVAGVMQHMDALISLLSSPHPSLSGVIHTRGVQPK